MSKEMQPGEGQIILYTTPEGRARVEVFFREETFWLSQRRMADMFGVEVNTVNYHLKEIYESAELVEAATIRKFRIVQVEGGAEGRQRSRFLQSGRHYRGRLPGEQPSGHAISHVGHANIAGVYHQGIRSGR